MDAVNEEVDKTILDLLQGKGDIDKILKGIDDITKYINSFTTILNKTKNDLRVNQQMSVLLDSNIKADTTEINNNRNKILRIKKEIKILEEEMKSEQKKLGEMKCCSGIYQLLLEEYSKVAKENYELKQQYEDEFEKGLLLQEYEELQKEEKTLKNEYSNNIK